ncbi:YdeI/OmpD-associated family protein [Flavobacterium sp. F-65]|uniref:YdeI/OmpD-associated family protein n=1 Tax=Flavobacterium pisciphilum TaxID=2893755 RepID=A0ABS8MNU5_9FLAO|nr:YdeI/OmpD-associated family protein [Flavobacterium sp. F-65]MCC9070432.1 YdeI/OmpD-associated family protein [Flavobacterium sp. F-65]
MIALFFENQSEFRKWLIINHQLETELLVGFHKINSNKPSMTWSQSVDQALCFGWIDGVRRSIDKDSYSIRFTPRKSTSIWSAINIQKIEDLTQQGLMQPAGLASFKLRKEDKSRIYTHEIAEVHFTEEFEKIFKANKKAWDYFQNLAPSYKKVSKNWVMSAKQEATRIKRLNELITDSEASKNKWKN